MQFTRSTRIQKSLVEISIQIFHSECHENIYQAKQHETETYQKGNSNHTSKYICHNDVSKYHGQYAPHKIDPPAAITSFFSSEWTCKQNDPVEDHPESYNKWENGCCDGRIEKQDHCNKYV